MEHGYHCSRHVFKKLVLFAAYNYPVCSLSMTFMVDQFSHICKMLGIKGDGHTGSIHAVLICFFSLSPGH